MFPKYDMIPNMFYRCIELNTVKLPMQPDAAFVVVPKLVHNDLTTWTWDYHDQL